MVPPLKLLRINLFLGDIHSGFKNAMNQKKMLSLFSGSLDRDRQGFGIGPVCPYNLHYFVHTLSTGSPKESVFPIIRMIQSAKYMPRKIAKSFSSKATVNKEVFQKGVRGQKREVPNEASKYRQKYFNSTSLKTLSNSVHEPIRYRRSA